MGISEENWERLLLKVQKPSRYIGGEINSFRKDWGSVEARMVFAFPDTYEVGMSHFGMSLLYNHVNNHEKFLADRVFAPWLDMERELRASGLPLLSIDQKRPLKDFDIIGFSLQYELSYTNILTILDLSNIAFRAIEREKDESPLIVGGGPCTFNPEPIAPFFDFFVIGEAEETIVEILERIVDFKKNRGDKLDFLRDLRHIPGIYVPLFFKDNYDRKGFFSGITPTFPDHQSVEKAIISDLDEKSPLPLKPVVPFMKIVHDRLSVEIARGCTRGCRFCQAGMIYRPVRERDPLKVMEIADRALETTGFEEVSLLSLSSGDYSNIEFLLRNMMSRHRAEKVSIALPSLRIGTLTSRLIEEIRKVRKTGFTLAPEAGSERLRRVINKDISTDELLQVSSYIYENGWQLIKLYFMMGLPTETKEDLEDLVELCFKVWRIGGKARPKGRVNVSVSTFVPKPHTPFQWCGQIPLEQIYRNLDFFKGKLKKPGIQLKWHNPPQSFLEAIFARGDRRLSEVIARAWKMGARFDGWTEQFRLEIWKEAFKESKLPGHLWEPSEKRMRDPLPWDHLHSKVEKKYLEKEYEKALAGEYTPDCRWKKCLKCGVCDFNTLQPVIKNIEGIAKLANPSSPRAAKEGQFFYLCKFTKLKMARLLSHLELVQVFNRATRRAKLPIAFSRGFNPHMKMAFWQALPVGFESKCEYFTMELEKRLSTELILTNLNKELPCGIEIVQADFAQKLAPWPSEFIVVYRATLYDKEWPGELWEKFTSNPRPVERVTKKGKKRTFDTMNYVESLEFLTSRELQVHLRQNMFGCLSLLEVISVIFGHDYAKPSEINVVKLDILPATGDKLWQQS